MFVPFSLPLTDVYIQSTLPEYNHKISKRAFSDKNTKNSSNILL